MDKKSNQDTGVPIYRHTSRTKPLKMASYECRYLEDIQKHIGKHIGESDDVLHEILSPTVHVDIYIVKPSDEIPYLTLITSGMSDLDMTVPEGVEPAEEYRLAEMIAFLPPDWPIGGFSGISDGKENDPPGWYVAGWMKHYARMPHEYQSLLSWFHTTANGDPASPIEKDIGMVGFLFAPALQLGPQGLFIHTYDDRQIRLLNLIPIWPDEVAYAVKKGGEALCDKLDGVENFVFDPARQSCLKRKKFFGLF
jgi:Suppressor of fused protein (SUFU)